MIACVCAVLQESYVETQTVHLPRLLYNLLTMLKENLANTSLSDVTHVLMLCRRLVSVALPRDTHSADEGLLQYLLQCTTTVCYGTHYSNHYNVYSVLQYSLH